MLDTRGNGPKETLLVDNLDSELRDATQREMEGVCDKQEIAKNDKTRKLYILLMGLSGKERDTDAIDWLYTGISSKITPEQRKKFLDSEDPTVRDTMEYLIKKEKQQNP